MFAPAADLAETRLQVQHRALVSLFTQAFEKITDLQLWKEELEKQRELLAFKVQQPEDTDLKTDLNHTETDDDQIQESLEVLGDIKRKVEEIKAELDTPEDRLDHLNAVLLNPEQHLRLETVSLKLSRWVFGWNILPQNRPMNSQWRNLSWVKTQNGYYYGSEWSKHLFCRPDNQSQKIRCNLMAGTKLF